MQYLDFKLTMQPKDDGARTYNYVVDGPRDIAASGVLDLSTGLADLLALRKELAREVLLRPPHASGSSVLPVRRSRRRDAARRLGEALFEQVFQGEIRSRFDSAYRIADEQRAGLRISLRLTSCPLLNRLPWEYLVRERQFVQLSRKTPVIRFIGGGESAQPVGVSGPLRILVVTSLPGDLSALKAAAERQAIQRAWLGADDERVIIHTIAGTWDALREALESDSAYHVLHFIGHGDLGPDGVGRLAFTDAQGESDPISAAYLAPLLKEHESLRLVVVNACSGAEASALDAFSSIASVLFDRAATAVIAMQFRISDAAAVRFARCFYRAIASGAPVETALSEARIDEHYAEPGRSPYPSLEWGTPVLYLRDHGSLFEVEPLRATSRFDDATPPYRGLQVFEDTHAELFFGRDDEARALLERLERGEPLVTLVAASGSGKSSLVRAKVQPAVAGWSGWSVAIMRPRQQPCTELAKALVDALPAADDVPRTRKDLARQFGEAGTDETQAVALLAEVARRLRASTDVLLIIVDQFEEIFAPAAAAQRRAFLRCLRRPIEPGGPVRVLLTLRADFTEDFLQAEAFAPLPEGSLQPLTPMTEAQLRAVIEKPAALAGYHIEGGLTGTLVREAIGEPGALPLLSFLLTRLWEERDRERGSLTWEAFEGLDGLKGYLNTYAEDKTLELPEEQVRAVFLQLVHVGHRGQDTRRRVEREALQVKSSPDVVQTLVRARLLVADESGAIEVAHEALLRHWTRLREWIDDRRDDIKLRQRIEQDAEAYVREPPEADLLRGVKLRRARALLEDDTLVLADGVARFVRVSVGLRAVEAAMDKAESARAVARQQAAERQRLRRIGFGLMAALIIAVVVAAVLFESQKRAERALAEAEMSRAAAIIYSIARGQANREAQQAREDQQQAKINAAQARAEQSRSEAEAAEAATEAAEEIGKGIRERACRSALRSVAAGIPGSVLEGLSDLPTARHLDAMRLLRRESAPTCGRLVSLLYGRLDLRMPNLRRSSRSGPGELRTNAGSLLYYPRSAGPCYLSGWIHGWAKAHSGWIGFFDESSGDGQSSIVWLHSDGADEVQLSPWHLHTIKDAQVWVDSRKKRTLVLTDTKSGCHRDDRLTAWMVGHGPVLWFEGVESDAVAEPDAMAEPDATVENDARVEPDTCDLDSTGLNDFRVNADCTRVKNAYGNEWLIPSSRTDQDPSSTLWFRPSKACGLRSKMEPVSEITPLPFPRLRAESEMWRPADSATSYPSRLGSPTTPSSDGLWHCSNETLEALRGHWPAINPKCTKTGLALATWIPEGREGDRFGPKTLVGRPRNYELDLVGRTDRVIEASQHTIGDYFVFYHETRVVVPAGPLPDEGVSVGPGVGVLYRSASGAELRLLDSNGSKQLAFRLGKDARILVAKSSVLVVEGRRLSVVSPDSGRLFQLGLGYPIAYSPELDLLAILDGKRVRVMHLASGVPLSTWHALPGPIEAAGFGADGLTVQLKSGEIWRRRFPTEPLRQPEEEEEDEKWTVDDLRQVSAPSCFPTQGDAD